MNKKIVQITADNITFNCHLQPDRVVLIRHGSVLSIDDYEIVAGYCHQFVSSKAHNFELQNHLAAYRKALEKINKIKIFV